MDSTHVHNEQGMCVVCFEHGKVIGRVVTVDEYCSKLREWAELMRQAYATKPLRGQPQGEGFVEHLAAVSLAIYKSSLLRRTLYEGEEPRKQPCDLHKGVWSGCYPTPPSHALLGDDTVCNCWDGFECSGWVPGS